MQCVHSTERRLRCAVLHKIKNASSVFLGEFVSTQKTLVGFVISALVVATKETGLAVNADKTKYMVMS